MAGRLSRPMTSLRLLLMGYAFRGRRKPGPRLSSRGVAKVRVRDVDWTVVSPRATGLEFLSSRNSKPIIANKPFAARAKVMNGPQDGLGKIDWELPVANGHSGYGCSQRGTRSDICRLECGNCWSARGNCRQSKGELDRRGGPLNSNAKGNGQLISSDC